MRFLLILAAIAAGASAQTPPSSAPAKTAAAKKTAPKAAAKASTTKSTIAKSTIPKGTTAKSTATKSSASTTAKSKVGTSKIASKGNAKAKTTASKSKQLAVGPRRPPTQQQPTSDRYKEIQQALADKGYFQGPADGSWGPDSADALKRFQREQNLDADGKLSALSLMALGLGPRRGGASAEAVKPPDAAGGPIPADPPPIAQPRP